MDENIFVVVGDSFASFAERPNVMTVSQLQQWLEAGDMWSGQESVIIGQGIDEAVRESLRSQLTLSGVACISHIDALAPLALTHKRSRAAVLIGAPHRTEPRCYEYGFIMNDMLDRLSDHVTGQHIGAIVLMEAARQATIASIECEWIAGQSVPQGFILESFNARFHTYVFPLPTTLRVRMDLREQTDTQIGIALAIEFHQAGKCVSQMELDVRLLHSAVLNRIEIRRAAQALDTVIRQQAALPPASCVLT